MDLTLRISSQTYALSKLISARLLFVLDQDDDEVDTLSCLSLSIIDEFALFSINDRPKIGIA